MLSRFWALSIPLKVIIIAGILVVGIWILDATTGYVSDVKSWMFDKKQEQTDKRIADLEKQNEELRKQKLEFEIKAEQAELREEAITKKASEKTVALQQEKDRINQVLEELKDEEAITAMDTDAYTRCIRTRAKLIERNIKSAQDINCETRR